MRNRCDDKLKAEVYDKRKRIFDKSDQITGEERGKRLACDIIKEIQKSR